MRLHKHAEMTLGYSTWREGRNYTTKEIQIRVGLRVGASISRKVTESGLSIKNIFFLDNDTITKAFFKRAAIVGSRAL